MKLLPELESLAGVPGKSWSAADRIRFINWLFGPAGRYLCVIALSALGSQATLEDAKEALNDFALKKLNGVIEAYSPGNRTNPFTYLVFCLKNFCYTQSRRIQERSRYESPLPSYDSDDGEEVEIEFESVNTEGDPEATAYAQQCREVLAKCLSKLPSRLRDIVVRHYLGDQDFATISRELAMTVVNARVHIHRARHALKKCVMASGLDADLSLALK